MLDESKLPRYAIFRKKKVRIIGYEDGKFLILDSNDDERKVDRSQLTFLKTKKT